MSWNRWRSKIKFKFKLNAINTYSMCLSKGCACEWMIVILCAGVCEIVWEFCNFLFCYLWVRLLSVHDTFGTKGKGVGTFGNRYMTTSVHMRSISVRSTISIHHYVAGGKMRTCGSADFKCVKCGCCCGRKSAFYPYTRQPKFNCFSW